MIRRIHLLLIITLYGLLGSQSHEYQVKAEASNMVTFISRAPLEAFEGKTADIDGYLYWEGDSPIGGMVYFEVNVLSITTGIGLRDRHMRENYLEADKWPKTFYKGTIAEWEEITPDSIKVRANGTIFIHGVERPLPVEAILSRTSDGFRIRSEFQVRLPDFSIQVPKVMFLKLDENILLKLDFYVQKARR